MASLVCAVCLRPPGEGKLCQHCQASLAENGALVDPDVLTAELTPLPEPSPSQPDLGERPATRGCSVTGCTNPLPRGRTMCDAHRDQVWSEEHRDYVVLCTNGWEVEVRDGMTVTLGRYPTESPWAHHLTEEKFVSRRHASLTSRDGKLVVRDHNSRNGTRVRGVRIEPEVEHVLVPGDQLRLGGKVDFYVR